MLTRSRGTVGKCICVSRLYRISLGFGRASSRMEEVPLASTAVLSLDCGIPQTRSLHLRRAPRGSP